MPYETRVPRARHLGGLVWPSIKWRFGSSLVFLVVAIAAVTAATAGPIYLAAANQSVTEATLLVASPVVGGVFIQTVPGVSEASTSPLRAAVAELPGGSGTSPRDRYGPAILTVDETGSLPNPTTGNGARVDIESRSGVCSQVRIVAGHCPSTADDVMLSTRSAAEIRVHLGGHIFPGGRVGAGAAGGLTVVGLYAVGNPTNPYWWSENPFPFGSPAGTSIFIDDAFVSSAGAAREGAVLPGTVLAQAPVRPSAVRASQIPLVLSQLSSFESSLAPLHLVASSGLPGLLATVELQEHQIRTIVGAAALELVLLALFVLYQVAASNAAERSGDLEIAELRGLRRRSIAVLALREPAILLALATPIGAVLGWLLVTLLAPHVFEPGSRATIDKLALWVAIGTFVAGFAAAALGCRSLVRPSLAREGRSAADRRSRRNATVIDLLAVVLAAAAVVEVATTHSSAAAGAPLDPLASLAPGALALAAGILAARLLPLGARLVARATRWSPRVALALASRSIMRRTGVARRVVVLVIAVGVLVFSVAGFFLAKTNRATQAAFQVGAPDVLTVTVAPGVSFEQAVEAADPSGREAMAVAKISSNSATLAVDSSRLAAIASWPSGTTTTPASIQSIARYLAPPVAPAVTLAGVRAIRLRVQLSRTIVPAPQLVLNLFDEQDYTSANLNLGSPLKKGSNEANISLDGACTLICRVDSISLVWSPGAASSVTSVVVPLVFSDVQVQRGGTWDADDLEMTTQGGWAENTATGSGPGQAATAGSGSISLRATDTSLSAMFHVMASATTPSIGPDDLPPLLPSVVTTTLAEINVNPAHPDEFPAAGLDGSELTSVAQIEAGSLPGIGDNGALIDLGFAEADLQGPPAGVTYEVWCHDPPSAALVHRLAERGVTVVGRQTSAGADVRLGRTAPSLGFDLFVLGAVGSALLALGALLFSVASDSRRRSIEFASLNAVGVPLRVLRRSLLLEQAVIVVVGVVLGVVAGLIAGELSLGLLPEFPPGRQGPVLPTSVGVGATNGLIAAGVLLVLLLAGAIVASLLTMRRVHPENVRSSS